MSVLKKINGVPGLYRHPNSRVYFERIQTQTTDTFESLQTTNQEIAKAI